MRPFLLGRLWPRQTQLGAAFSRRFVSTDSRIRNLGIIAHIDAGKTTTTERMLYYAGVTKRLGNVDSGDTVTDYLEAERERGITIQSAAITFNWNDYQINLIDTPGHADFNFEVVRSLRVLDGAITILDSVAGVEALTEKVWGLASQLQIPRILYLNKMDRAGAGFSRTIKEAVSKLQTPVAMLNIPYFEGEKFCGIIDILHGQRIVYKSEDGKQIEVKPCSETPQANEAVEARTALIEQISDVDPEVLETFIEHEDVPNEMLVAALRKACISNKIVPVLCGSSFRNIGIQPLLDAAIQYLPAPNESGTSTTSDSLTPAKSTNSSDVVRMLAFKVRQDPQRGTLVFVRIYSGVLKKNATVYNSSNKQSERISRLLRMQADEPQEINSAQAGEIAVLGGTTGIRTGDTLVAHPSKLNGVSSLSKEDKELALQPIDVPPPVFVVRISPKGPGDTRGMNAALDILLREDPSLHLSYDEEAGQHLLSGMGELHLEIATNRLVDDLKARVDIGDVMITYKETLKPGINPSEALEDTDSNGATTKVTISITPRSDDALEATSKGKELIDSNRVFTRFKRHHSINFHEVNDAVSVGIIPVLARGGQLGHSALFGLDFNISVEIGPEASAPELVSELVRNATSSALNESLGSSDFELLEPMMAVQVSVPQSAVGTVMTDLTTTRRGTIGGLSDEESGIDGANEEGVDYHSMAENLWAPVDHTMYMSKHEDQQGAQVQLEAKVPLRKMVGYLSSLRSMTQGRGTFEMSFSEFSPVPPQDVEQVLEE